MKGLVTRCFPYKSFPKKSDGFPDKSKPGEAKVMVTVLSLENGQTDMLYLTSAEFEEKELSSKVLVQADFDALSKDYETIDYTPANKVASIN